MYILNNTKYRFRKKKFFCFQCKVLQWYIQIKNVIPKIRPKIACLWISCSFTISIDEYIGNLNISWNYFSVNCRTALNVFLEKLSFPVIKKTLNIYSDWWEHLYLLFLINRRLRKSIVLSFSSGFANHDT